MATLSNFGKVATQIQTQQISGSVYNAFNIQTGVANDTLLSGLTQELGDEWQGKHDSEILRSLAFPQMLDRRGDIEKPHVGTCQWILDLPQYRQWTSSSGGLLWVKGHPGSGKSTMMSFLYDRLETEVRKEGDIRLDFFFSARGSTLQHSPLGMLRSMLNQLFAQDEDVRPLTRSLFGDKSRVYGENWTAWNWQRTELESLLSRSIAKSAEKRRVMIFIDALDEAGEQSARDIARYLLQVNDQISKNSGTAKILIACRHYPIASIVPGIEVWMEQYNHPDIIAFVRSRLFTGLLDENDEQWQNVTSVLLQRARGIFQWTRLVVPMVEKLVLDGEQPPEIQDWLRRVPTELSEVYEQIIRTVIDTRSRRQSALLFLWICLAQRPLTLGNVFHALASDNAASLPLTTSSKQGRDSSIRGKQIKSRIKALSGGLIEVVRPHDDSLDQIVQVVHQSVNDYLLECGLAVVLSLQSTRDTEIFTSSSDVQADLVVSQCHKILYKCCLNYLKAYRTLVNKIKIPDMEAKVTDAGELSRLIEYSSTSRSESSADSRGPMESWMRYVTENMFIHARLVIQFDRDELKSDIHQLEPFMDEWVKSFRAHGGLSMRPALGSHLLHVAAAFDLKDFVQHLTTMGYDPNARDGEGRTSLYIAASNGNLRAATTLAQASADLTAMLSHDLLQGPPVSMPMTALSVAVAHSHEPFVIWLLDQGADINEAVEGAETVLMIAVRRGYYSLVRLLLDRGADINKFSGPSFGYALHAAAYFGDMELLYILIEGGADVNIHGGRYGTALRAAFARRRMEAMRTLVAHGANFDALGSFDSLLSYLDPHQARFVEKLVKDYNIAPREDFDKHCFISLATDELKEPPIVKR